MFRNKKGDDRYISFWLFLNWGLILGAIVVMVLLFYGAKMDVREEEAKIIGLKLADCLIDSGKFNDTFLSEDFNIFSSCGLNRDAMWNGDYFFNVSVFQDGQLKKENVTGVADFETLCELSKTSKGDFPLCYEDTFHADNGFDIKVYTASNQAGLKI
ncbi:hypothetical protein A3K73_00110 [Candidatus Pacearchaeota archaeon RBG_13_36_9]|nr:MAG: hypothetical protein A3K73_00110 [Candidatus Pacearchaeota archaeon RBG_13_36_9]